MQAESIWLSDLLSRRAVTVLVWAVPMHLRALASGLAQVASHVLGDVPAPPLVGLMQGVVPPPHVLCMCPPLPHIAPRGLRMLAPSVHHAPCHVFHFTLMLEHCL